MTIPEILSELETAKTGLGEEDASARLKHDGWNEVPPEAKTGLVRRFLLQFKDFMIIILLAAAILSFMVSMWEGENSYTDSVMILLIVVLNAVLGVIQEAKAERSLEALQKLAAPNAIVLRSGKRKQIPARELVRGDIVFLQTGNYVPADVRLLEAEELRIDESALTGESAPVRKNVEHRPEPGSLAGDRKNMAYAMTAVTKGRGVGVVTATGLQTEAGRIAGLIRENREKMTPLQLRLEKIGTFLGIMSVVICIVIFLIGVWQKRPLFQMFMTAVSLAVAAIPEGLPAIVTIMLSLGVQRMAKKRAVIRKLAAVETLGSATVICSDKTGTLTKNRLTVTEYALPEGVIHEGINRGRKENGIHFMLEQAVLCSNAEEEPGGRQFGEPLELALLRAARLHGISTEQVRGRYERIGEIPFDSTRKRMTTVHKCPDGSRRIIIKGAFDYLLPMCTAYRDGREYPLDYMMRSQLNRLHTQMAGAALRITAVIYKEIRAEGTLQEGSIGEQNFIFLGLLGMQDPPREEAIHAVEICKAAGITPVMVTGDHALTAAAIAEKVGIHAGGKVLTGTMLQKMSDEELTEEVKKCRVFARVSPEHKVRIVRAFQSNGEVVAMTGDGINDAPALKAANIGCAMGKAGTDVAKNSADMILTDDNFATIVEAVREGRSIYDNIIKSIHFLLSSNIGEILTILVAIICRLPAPLAAVQLLWVNLVTDSLPAIALGVEPPEKDIMKRSPVPLKKGIFSDGMGTTILLEGCMIGILALIAYALGGQTMTFAVLSLTQLVHAYNVRSSRSVFREGLLKNHKMNLAFIIGLVLQIIVITVPSLADIFHTVPMTLRQWSITGILSLMPLLVVELQKRILNRS